MNTATIPFNSTTSSLPSLDLTPKRGAKRQGRSSSDVAALISILVMLQILDGILTSIGVYNFGENIEGNELIRNFMNQVGYLNALLLIKLGAIGLVLSLYPLARYVSWMKTALKLLNTVYFCAAILPWSAIMMDYFS